MTLEEAKKSIEDREKQASEQYAEKCKEICTDILGGKPSQDREIKELDLRSLTRFKQESNSMLFVLNILRNVTQPPKK